MSERQAKRHFGLGPDGWSTSSLRAHRFLHRAPCWPAVAWPLLVSCRPSLCHEQKMALRLTGRDVSLGLLLLQAAVCRLRVCRRHHARIWICLRLRLYLGPPVPICGYHADVAAVHLGNFFCFFRLCHSFDIFLRFRAFWSGGSGSCYGCSLCLCFPLSGFGSCADQNLSPLSDGNFWTTGRTSWQTRSERFLALALAGYQKPESCLSLIGQDLL